MYKDFLKNNLVQYTHFMDKCHILQMFDPDRVLGRIKQDMLAKLGIALKEKVAVTYSTIHETMTERIEMRLYALSPMEFHTLTANYSQMRDTLERLADEGGHDAIRTMWEVTEREGICHLAGLEVNNEDEDNTGS